MKLYKPRKPHARLLTKQGIAAREPRPVSKYVYQDISFSLKHDEHEPSIWADCSDADSGSRL